jgi:hypothetical protein
MSYWLFPNKAFAGSSKLAAADVKRLILPVPKELSLPTNGRLAYSTLALTIFHFPLCANEQWQMLNAQC